MCKKRNKHSNVKLMCTFIFSAGAHSHAQSVSMFPWQPFCLLELMLGCFQKVTVTVEQTLGHLYNACLKKSFSFDDGIT